MLDQATLQRKLSQSPAPRVTEDYIKSRIEEVHFTFMKDTTRADDTTTICTIYLDNGYTVRGESACVNPENFDPEIGKHYAEADAMKKLWPLFGFLLAEVTFNKPVSEPQAA